MQQLQHPNIMPLLAHSRAMAPMDADQGVTTYYMLFPLFQVMFFCTFPVSDLCQLPILKRGPHVNQDAQQVRPPMA